MYKMLACVSVHLSCWFLSHVKSVWGVGGIIGPGLARGCCNLRFTQFFALLCIISLDFYAMSHNFINFGANLNMLGITMHVLKLRYSMVILSHTLMHLFTQCHTFFTQFWLIHQLRLNFMIWGPQETIRDNNFEYFGPWTRTVCDGDKRNGQMSTFVNWGNSL